MRALVIHRIGPGATVQDRGRPGHLGQGLSRGGAADPLALAEGAALLGQDGDCAALEMPVFGGEFSATAPVRIALTGAEMPASLGGTRLAWNASHLLLPDQTLKLGAARTGTYGYLHLGGGLETPEILGARSAHLAAGIGAPVAAGDRLPVGNDPGRDTGLQIAVSDRFSGGLVRFVEGIQTRSFPAEVRARFEATEFTRSARANRMGVRLEHDGPAFAAAGQLSILSEVIVPGDIQLAGDGQPFVLMPECQTTGGYPRIGTVIPADMPRVAQAPAGAGLRFAQISLDQAMAAHLRFVREIETLPASTAPIVRDPRTMPDLLAQQLIGGVVNAQEPETEDPA